MHVSIDVISIFSYSSKLKSGLIFLASKQEWFRFICTQTLSLLKSKQYKHFQKLKYIQYFDSKQQQQQQKMSWSIVVQQILLPSHEMQLSLSNHRKSCFSQWNCITFQGVSARKYHHLWLF